MKLSRSDIEEIMHMWAEAWNRHDLDEVMKLFHDDVVFENLTRSRVTGKDALRKAWTPWFANHGNFCFISEDMIIDEDEQMVIWRWYLDWPLSKQDTRGNQSVEGAWM